MATNVNLIRNTRLFFTTNVDAPTGRWRGYNNWDGGTSTPAEPTTTTNTVEIQVLDGFSFSQNTTSDTITLNEAGPTPIRGQRSFNTALEPADFSFSTYIRPKAGTNATSAEESVLWDAISNGGWSQLDTSYATATVDFDDSNEHQLTKFALIMCIDNDTFVLQNCVLDQASIDFGIDAIATVAWTGKAARLEKLSTSLILTDDEANSQVTFTGGPTGVSGNAKLKDTTAYYIANKLSLCTIGYNSKSYTVGITGGNLTINNNVTYLTPANLGVVNLPITYFTGTRAVSGNVTAYLKSGELTDTSSLLADLLANADNTTEPDVEVDIDIGGSQIPTVKLFCAHAVAQIPTVSSESVMSTTINFTAQGYSTAFDVTETNELVITYKAADPVAP